METERIILGIDPGTNVMGFGLIKVQKSSAELVFLDELLLGKYANQQLKLKKIFERTIAIVTQYLPDEVAIEEPFYGKNVQSMLKLGRAQGVAMAAVLSKEIPITEYTPKKIKMAITGNGNASKEQVAKMLQQLLNIKSFTIGHDATDGLAVAMCHYYNKNTHENSTRCGNWKTFIQQNQSRIIQ